jgi:hypothetical protein
MLHKKKGQILEEREGETNGEQWLQDNPNKMETSED